MEQAILTIWGPLPLGAHAPDQVPACKICCEEIDEQAVCADICSLCHWRLFILEADCA